jgi:hypothetical protein
MLELLRKPAFGVRGRASGLPQRGSQVEDMREGVPGREWRATTDMGMENWRRRQGVDIRSYMPRRPQPILL